jgi:acyl-coenzyme A synthetase/AMP-(fatty) acid ligase
VTAADWWGADLVGWGADDLPWARARRTVTRGELRRQVATLEALFGRLGVGPGSTVALRGSPSFTQLWALFAVWARGAQAMLIDPRLRGPRLRERLALFRPEYEITFGGPGQGLVPFRDESELAFHRLPGGRPARSEHRLIQFTSGTTGATTAAGRTAGSLLDELAAIASVPGMPAAGERVLLLESPVYSFGLVGGVLAGTRSGAVLVFAPDQRAERLARTAAETAADVVIGNPRHFAALAGVPDAPPLPALRGAVSSGETLPLAVHDRFAERYGVRVGQAYGLTETGIVAADPAGEHGPAAVGPPVPGVRVRLTGGELEVYVPVSPYVGEAPGPAGRWLRTGDLATRDPVTGVIRLHGRAGPGARPVDVVAIETVLRAHERVGEAVVIAGERIEAYVEATHALSPAELVEWCRRRLGEDQVPVRCRVIPALPRTLNGKLIRDRELLLG